MATTETEMSGMPATPSASSGSGRSDDRSAFQLTPALLNLEHGYESFLKAQKYHWPAIPEVPVSFSDVDCEVPVPVVSPTYDTIATAAVKAVQFWKKPETKPFPLLKGITGTLNPGSMTLVLAPPGHGKTSLLQLVAGKLKPTRGSVRYAGRTLEELTTEGVSLDKLTNFAPQVDVHLSLLTVRETFQFAVDNSTADSSILSPQLQEIQKRKVDTLLKVLGLEECQDTMLGNELIRGVSGGQKKRVTLGEALLMEARILCLDEVTNGLDSATAFDVFRALRSWAQIFKGTVITALQQPTPELFALFDQVMLLREGHLVYSGPRTQVLAYFEGLGVYCPADRDYCDFLIDFLSEPFKYVKHMKHRLAQAVNQADGTPSITEKKTPHLGVPAHTPGLDTSPMTDRKRAQLNDQLANSADASVLSTTGLQKKFLESEEHAFARKEIADNDAASKKASLLTSEWAKAQYGQRFVRSNGFITQSLLSRQFKYMARNKGLIGPRVGQGIVMGLILGSVYYMRTPTDFAARIALILFGLTFMAFANLAEIPVVFESKRVMYKQTDASLYPVGNYVLSVVIAHFPLAIAETVFFTILIYFISGFVYGAGEFFTFLAIMLTNNFALSVWFRTLAFFAPNEEIAQAMSGPSTGVFLLFGGFFVTRDKIPNFMIWLYYLSPFSWTTRALAVNEFSSDRYDDLINVSGSPTRTGDLYLSQFQLDGDKNYIFAAVIMMMGYFVLLSVLSAIVLTYKRYELSRGTKRYDEKEVAVDEFAEEPEESPAHAKPPTIAEASVTQQSIATSLPFTPVTLAFNNIKFSIYVPPKKPTNNLASPSSAALVPSPSSAGPSPSSASGAAADHHKFGKQPNRTLLQGVSGYAKPGTLTALMGASGAGKTTLMDVLAGRKTQGRIEGDILVNGKPKRRRPFAKVSGYVEQFDYHISTDTVYETLLFAAKLRLPSDVTEQQRVTFVTEVLTLLELDDVKNVLIGDDKLPGLSPGQLKRVTIGVELVANPSVLFLDEPTTGLDSKTARQVMRVIKRIAATGRSVVCTIHQPSSEIFFMFDRLLLLASGGYPVYFGPIGRRGRSLVQFFEAIPGVTPKPQRQNPATWMLDVIGAGALGAADEKEETDSENGDLSPVANRTASGNVPKPSFTAFYLQSELNRINQDELAKLSKIEVVVDSKPAALPSPSHSAESGAESDHDPNFAASTVTQYLELQRRAFRGHWRNVPYNFVRFIVLTVLSIVFGLTYLGLNDDDQAGLQSKVGVIFTTIGFFGIINSATGLPVVIASRAAYYREKAANTYSTLPYSVAIAVVEIPYIALNAIVYLIPFYFMVGLSNSGHVFFKHYLAIFLIGLIYSYMAQFLTALLPNKIVAGIVQGMYFSLFFLFGGVAIQGPAFPSGWYWAHKIDPMAFALEAALLTQYEGNSATVQVVVDGQFVTVHKDQFISSAYGFEYGNYWTMVGYLVLFMTVIRLLTTLCLKYIKHIKR